MKRLIVSLFILRTFVFAQDLQLKQIVISSGAVQSERLKGTVGQPVIGTTTTDNYILSAGFWGSISRMFLDVENVVVPTEYSISKAYPNPFNPVTSLVFNLQEDGNVMVQVYNLKGQVVSTLLSGYLSADIYNLTWDASQSPSGIYFVKAESAEYMQTQKLMLIK